MSNDTLLTPSGKPATPLAIAQHQITRLIESNQISFPPDYNVGNALASAKTVLLDTENRDKRRILDASGRPTGVVKEDSIINCLYDMCVQGLNPSKKQCYFIVRGDKLTMMRSYFGEEAIAKRLRPGIEIYSDVIYKGEKFRPAKIWSKFGFITVVAEHELAWPRTSKEIVGAYAGASSVNPETGELENMGIELMDIEQIRTSWKKSPSSGSPTSFHNEQPDIACKRTVLRRYCNRIINASSDTLLKASLQRQSEEEVEAAVAQDIEMGANRTPVNFSEPVQDAEFTTAPEPPAAAAAAAEPPKARTRTNPKPEQQHKPEQQPKQAPVVASEPTGLPWDDVPLDEPSVPDTFTPPQEVDIFADDEEF